MNRIEKMSNEQETARTVYTCSEYREEMILLALRRRLQQPDLPDEERKRLVDEIERLEKEFGF